MTAKLRESDITAIIDTREQTPWPLERHGFQVVRAALPFADYSVKGLENIIAIERKSLPDLTHSITKTRSAMDKRILALRSYRHSYLICESTISDIVAHRYRSKVAPASVIGTLAKYQFHGVSVLNADNSETACWLCARLLYFIVKEISGYAKILVDRMAEPVVSWPIPDRIDPPLPEMRESGNKKKQALQQKMS